MIAGCILLFALQVTPELQRHIESGLRAKSAGDLDTAIQEFARVAELAPGLAAAHVNLGAVYLQKKDYSRAAVSLNKALELNTDLQWRAWHARGRAARSGVCARGNPAPGKRSGR